MSGTSQQFYRCKFTGKHSCYPVMTKEKISEIKKSMRQGKSAEKLREELLKDGYSNEDIEKAFLSHRYFMRTWYQCLAVALFAIGAILYFNSRSALGIVFSLLLIAHFYSQNERLIKGA